MMLGIYYENLRQVYNNLTDVLINDDMSYYSSNLQDNLNINNKTFFLMNSLAIKKVNAVWRFLLQPAFNDLLNNLSTSMSDDINMRRVLYIVVFSLFIAVIMLGYFIFIIPHQVITHKDVYNAKNMLSIVSIEVLADLNNIKKLLNIQVDSGNVGGAH